MKKRKGVVLKGKGVRRKIEKIEARWRYHPNCCMTPERIGVDTVQVTCRVNREVVDRLNVLHSSGLWGFSFSDTLERFICRALMEEMRGRL